MNQSNQRLFLTLLLAVGLNAQDRQTTDPRIAKAVVAEQSERDLGRAATIYRAVLDDVKTDPATRVDAGLRLTAVLTRQGKADEARALGDRVAKLAEAQGSAIPSVVQQDDAVDTEIASLIEVLRSGSAPQSTIDQLVWLGERAVPRVIAAADAEPRMQGVTNLTAVLLRVGGSKVESWLDKVAANEDPLRRRAVVRALGAVGDGVLRIPRSRLARFGSDSDAEVRIESIRNGVLGRLDDFLSSLDHSDARVRQAAFEAFGAGAARTADDEAVPRASAERLLEIALRRDEIERGTGSVIQWFARNAPADLALRAWVRISVDRGQFGRIGSPALVSAEAADFVATDLVGAARAYAATGTPSARDGTELAIRNVIAKCTRASMPQLIELAEIGIGFDASTFVRLAIVSDWVELIGRLPGLRIDDDAMDSLMRSSFAVDLPAESFDPLREFFLANAGRSGMSGGLLGSLSIRLCLFDSDPALEFCEAMLEDGADKLKGVDTEALRNFLRSQFTAGLLSGDSPKRRALRLRLAVAPLRSMQAIRFVRNQLFARIIEDHDVEAGPVLARAYELGLEACDAARDVLATGPKRHSGRERGLGWLAGRQDWTEEEAASVISACLATGSADAWEDVRKLSSNKLTRTTSRAIAAQITRCPEPDRRRDWSLSLLKAFAEDPADRESLRLTLLSDVDAKVARTAFWMLNNDSPASKRFVDAVTARLTHPDATVVRDCLEFLTEAPDRVPYARVAELLGQDRPIIARAAALGLLRLDATRAIPELLARFERGGLESTLCEVAMRTLDRRFVPALVAALKTADENTRTQARETLEAIEYYVEQSQRWQRILDESGLDASSAAEALVIQTRNSDKAVRIAAIRSLGTLAKPETLPVLIKLMQDTDTDVKQAAAAALEKINSKQ